VFARLRRKVKLPNWMWRYLEGRHVAYHVLVAWLVILSPYYIWTVDHA
jgi:hypothetical protein